MTSFSSTYLRETSSLVERLDGAAVADVGGELRRRLPA